MKKLTREEYRVIQLKRAALAAKREGLHECKRRVGVKVVDSGVGGGVIVYRMLESQFEADELSCEPDCVVSPVFRAVLEAAFIVEQDRVTGRRRLAFGQPLRLTTRPLSRISGFGLLSGFGLRPSDFPSVRPTRAPAAECRERRI